VSPVRYELGLYIPEDASLHNHRRENLKSYTHPLEFRMMDMSLNQGSLSFIHQRQNLVNSECKNA
jgi:hypothetical protein